MKIDPKSIGVGQYQHDVDQRRLGQALDSTVEVCVNRVGVDLNTASFALLRHVAGINERTARKIVAYRDENGAFHTRAQLTKVPGFGPKTFEQAAPFPGTVRRGTCCAKTHRKHEEYSGNRTVKSSRSWRLAVFIIITNAELRDRLSRHE